MIRLIGALVKHIFGKMAFCDSCGHRLKPTAKFCGECGTRVQENIEENTGALPMPEGALPASDKPQFTSRLDQETPNLGRIHDDHKPSRNSDGTNYVKKTRTGIVWCGIIILGSIVFGAYVMPVNDPGMSLAQINDLCKGPLGLLGQAFGGEKAIEGCAQISHTMTIFNIVGILGFILILVGLFKKKTVAE